MALKTRWIKKKNIKEEEAINSVRGGYRELATEFHNQKVIVDLDKCSLIGLVEVKM